MELQIFNNPEFGAIRTVEIDGEIYFVGKDVATALGYKDTSRALLDFFGEKALEEFMAKAQSAFEVEDCWDIKEIPELKDVLINEYGVRILIDNADLPEKKKKSFKYWIVLDVFGLSFGDVKAFTDYGIRKPAVMVRFFQDCKEYLESPQYQQDQFKSYTRLITDKLTESSIAAKSNPVLCCVYVLEMSNGTVKIGYTRNIEKRMRNISNGSGLEILNHYKTEFIDSEIAYSIEQKCHAAFEGRRLKGEFFNINFDEACVKLKEIFSSKIELK